MIKDVIHIDVLLELHKLHLSLDHLYALELLSSYNTQGDIPNNIISLLKRKGYINGDLSLSLSGKLILSTLVDPKFEFKDNKVIKKKLEELKPSIIKDFDKFWETYPATDQWGFYPCTRSLRTNKEACEKKFQEAINSGISLEDLILSLKYEIYSKKKASKGQTFNSNKLSFFFNSLTWFNNPDSYKAYLSVAKAIEWDPKRLDDLEKGVADKPRENKTIDIKDMF